MSMNSFDDLLDALTSAVISAREILEAQHMNALNRYFVKDGDDHIPMTTKLDIPDPASGEDKSITIDVPLFALIPMNSLKIKDVEIEFETHISSLGSDDGNGEGKKKMQMELVGDGALGKKKNNAKVKICIAGDDPPEGLVKINNHILKRIP